MRWACPGGVAGRGGSTHRAGAGAWPAAGARAAEEGAGGRGAAIAAILRSADPGIPSVAAAADPAGLRTAEAVRRGAAPEEAGPRSQPGTGASQVRWPESGDPPPGPEPRPPSRAWRLRGPTQSPLESSRRAAMRQPS